MASSHSSDTDDEHERQTRRHKKKLRRETKAVETALEKQEARLSNLQSSAFQLANYYFVFQGVILTALCNRNTALRCSDRWFLATLSTLAAALNLAALVSIGDRYNRIVIEHARTWSKRNELQTELSNLQEQENRRREQQHHAYSSGYVDTFEIRKRQIYFGICILIFLGFAIIVFVGCLKILCRDHKT